MSLAVHKITVRQVRAIADGSSTNADLSILLESQRSKCLAMLALMVRLATGARHPEAAFAAEGWRLLARVQQRAPAVVEDLLRYPAVSAWATEAVLGLSAPSAPGVPPGRLALVAAAAAIRGGIPCAIDLPPSACTDAALSLPSLGSLVLPSGLRKQAVTFRYLGDAIEVAGQHQRVTLPGRLDADAPNWRAVPVITAGSGNTRIRVLLDDADPYRFSGYGAQLGGLTASDRDKWRRRLSGGWRLLTRDYHRAAEDVRFLIGAVTPMSSKGGAALSVTSRRVFGSIALSLPDDDLAMALTLCHEVQHAKLSALMDMLPMVSGSPAGQYYTPWRADPRPLAGLLQGMYAHLSVARFWRRRRDVAAEPAEVHHANVEFARWRAACAEVAEVLRTQQELTRCGSVFVDGMSDVVRGWRDEYVPPEAQAEADQAVSAHRARWAGAHALAAARGGRNLPRI